MVKYLKKFQSSGDLNNQNLLNFESPHIYSIDNSTNIDYEGRFEQLEYISSTSTGGQYIDLGCKLMENTDDIQIDMKFNFKGHGKTGIQQSTFIASQLEASPYPGFVCRIQSRDTEKISNIAIEFKLKWELNSMSTFLDGSGYFLNDWGPNTSGGDVTTHTKHFINNVYEESIILDNIPQSQCHNMNTHLFCALNSSGQPFRFSEVDVYYMRIYKGGTLLRSLWPVRRKSDNAIGLYDSVNDYLYISQGDQPFVGPQS